METKKSPQSFFPTLIALFLLLMHARAGLSQTFQASDSPTRQTYVADLNTENAALPEAPQAAQTEAQQVPQEPNQEGYKQTKRILFIVPNFRAVSVDEKLPPLSSKTKLKLAVQDSFDYSSFIYVGILAGVGQIQNSYPEFHQGAAGYARYYWHSFADTVVGNSFTEFILPAATHEDPRYYTLGRGGFVKRTVYSVGRLAFTRKDDGSTTVNISEIVGNGGAAGISNLYYPGPTRTWTKTGQKWLLQLGVDGLSNIAKEFWPEVNYHLFHNRE